MPRRLTASGQPTTPGWEPLRHSDGGLLGRVTPAASPTILAAVIRSRVSSSAGATLGKTRAPDALGWCYLAGEPDDVSRSARWIRRPIPGWVSSQSPQGLLVAASSERAAGARSGSSSWTAVPV